MRKYKNLHKTAFLNSIPQISIDDDDNNLSKRCKFNFSYFDNNNAGQDFKAWSKNELVKLLEKLKHYSKEPLSYWINQEQGKYPVFVKYPQFPQNTHFSRPKHIPHQAIWCRFHLENKPRLIGFVLPDEYHGKPHQTTGFKFDKNTFYVVFLDKEHQFYPMNKKIIIFIPQ